MAKKLVFTEFYSRQHTAIARVLGAAATLTLTTNSLSENEVVIRLAKERISAIWRFDVDHSRLRRSKNFSAWKKAYWDVVTKMVSRDVCEITVWYADRIGKTKYSAIIDLKPTYEFTSYRIILD